MSHFSNTFAKDCVFMIWDGICVALATGNPHIIIVQKKTSVSPE